MPTTTTHTNKLINEKSPYLLQHAHNPVDWYPWGDEAFQKAKAEDKPVFLSIGYSTCHWCHVMERESFEDEEVAALLNKNFISIKVDREERPDVDRFYMDICTALNGSGGWPLSCFLTPQRKAFFSGTYFPKRDSRYGNGFITILNQITDVWKNRRRDITAASDSIIAHINNAKDKSELKDNAPLKAYGQLMGAFDKNYGGFGGAPKFPSVQNLIFLMQYGLIYNEKQAFETVRKTLDCMADGGIYDHIGGGFCRYSTDNKWLVPHFEKMMVDNAMHIMAYSQASVLISPAYADKVKEIADFCMRDMRHPGGGFFTALDADSEGVEGKYYVFTPSEIAEALGEEDGDRYCELYHITTQGNFEGANIPNLIGTKQTEDERAFAQSANKRLLGYRSRREPPFRDDKVMTSVNGLMMAALAQAGRILGEKHYIECAERCAAFITGNLLRNGRLQSYWRDGAADVKASSDDYAYLTEGFIELYEATLDPVWLDKALTMTKDMHNLFWDEIDGGYFISGRDANELPLRQKNLHDGALPSGNAVAAGNLTRLSRICGFPQFEQSAKDIISLMAPQINAYPSSFCGALGTDLYLSSKGREIILVNGEGIEALKDCLPRFAPFTVTALCGTGYEIAALLAPFLKEYKALDSKATAYLCSGGACMQPVTDPADFRRMLENKPEA